ncbi:NB-ARC domain-containing protein [Streptomyces sp. NBC_01077]|uniref:AfsR/SARP family transcriptional regulator n=1 Tax=Streptomyces sp. NBC_01077 TaxID=2903746 RepID=UPI003869AAEB|nr:NB-ARC domain-containing protein [Streptomyces sp. NBC_01077]WSV43410.1 NB-ARC domain-containing protein [Streptomyces sp. NBC_01077]
MQGLTQAQARSGHLAVRLLGPVGARLGGERIELGPPQQQAVFAMLVLRRGHVVGVGQLVEGVWGSAAVPRSASSAVRTYVSQLRAALEPDRPVRSGSRLIVTVESGYRFLTPAVVVDAEVFAHESADRGGTAEAVYERLTCAVGRWQGVALAGVPGPWAERRREQLTESLAAARENLYAAAVELGRYGEVVAELRSMVREFPLRERSHGLLMLALQRTGRQVEAARVYDEACEVLARELGTEPAAELRDLHRGLRTGRRVHPFVWPGGTGVRPSPSSRAAATDDRRSGAPAAGGQAVPYLAAHRSAGAPGHRRQPSTGADRRPGAPVAVGPADRRPGAPVAVGTVQGGARRTAAPLPGDIGYFTGRSRLIGEIRDHLLQARPGHSPAMAVATVTGIGGVGKTALAVHVAHGLRAAFPDGQLYVGLRAGATPADPAGVLADLLSVLGTPPDRLPLDLEERAALLRTLLADRRVLLVLDDARDAAQVRPLLPGTAGSAVLLTTRAPHIAVPGARSFAVDVFAEAEAVTLLGTLAGSARVAAEPEAARALADSCGRLPLAVRIVGARLAALPRHSLRAFGARLTDTRTLLGELSHGDQAVEPAFQLGYRALTPDQARAFRLLSLLDAPDVPLPVAAALLGIEESAAEDLAESLVDTGMLESPAPGRYRLHDLLRLYGRRRGESTEPEDRAAALRRVLALLYGSAVHVARTALPDDVPSPPWLQTPGRAGIAFEDTEQARAWFRAEHAVLTSAVEQSLASVPDALRTAVDLLTLIAVCSLFPSRGHYEDACRLAGSAARRAAEAGEPEYRARALHTRAWLSSLVGQYAAAERDLREALAWAEATGSARRLHMSGVLLALVLRATGRVGESQAAMARAEHFAGDPDDPASPAGFARFVARLHVAVGADQPPLGLPLMTPLMRRVDAHGTSLVKAQGVVRLGAALSGLATSDD